MDNFDTERFIIEIQNRPSIWDNSSSEYSERDLKKKCWEEIVDLFGEQEQTVEQKKSLGLVLQKRWKSIRSCYAREVKSQKKFKSGSVATNRKSEYIYFKQLQFLQKVVAIREEGVEEENSESTEVGERPKQTITNKRKQTVDDDPFVQALNNSIEQRRRETTEQRLRETAEVDEDRLFLLSLLSTLKNLPPQVKMATKIKMLTLFNDASDFSGNRTFDYADRSFRHTSEINPGGRMVSHENYLPGYSTQRQVIATKYRGPRTNTNYHNETITNSPNSPYNSMNTMTYVSSPSDTNDSHDSETLVDLFGT